MKPIVLDIETSRLDYGKCGIWQIGAIDLNDLSKEFYEEGKIDKEDVVDGKALEIIGKTEEELRENSKQSQKQLLENLFGWVSARPMKTLLCQNPLFDFTFLETKAKKYGLKFPIHYRNFNLHDIAQIKYHDLNNKFLIKEDHSDMGLKNILNFCGIGDNRGAHNALEDAKLTAECFSRLMYRKNLFPEYAKFEMPKELRK